MGARHHIPLVLLLGDLVANIPLEVLISSCIDEYHEQKQSKDCPLRVTHWEHFPVRCSSLVSDNQLLRSHPDTPNLMMMVMTVL